MRFAVLAFAAAALVGCRNKSKLDIDSGVETLWDLAPDGTAFAIVASPRAMAFGFRAIAAIRQLSSHPDLAPARPQLEAIVTSLFGSDTATPEDAGFSQQKPFAMFHTGDGVIAVMPVGDRDKFMAAKKGTRGSAEDTLDGTICRMLGGNYTCASSVEMFDRIGKGKLRGKVAGIVGARGDAELYLTNLTLLGEAKGELGLVAQLDVGQVSLHGRWAGTPSEPMDKLINVAAPKPDTKGTSGFATINVAPLINDLPALPIAGGVTFDQLGKSLVGPLTAVIPAGTVDIQLFAPLIDPKPAQTVLDNCKEEELGRWFKLAEKQQPGACRIVLQGTNALELDAWVEGNTLRLGAKKGPMPAGKPSGMTSVGRELASGPWTASFWGRGTMLNLSGIEPAKETVPAEVALGIHAMAVVNELGAAVRVEKDGVRVRAFLRTAWANPPALANQLVTVPGNDIVTRKATETGKALAAAHKSTTFATDFESGQGGLMIPAAVIGLASVIIVPAIMRMFGAGEPEPGIGDSAPMGQSDLMQLLLRAYVEEAYPQWRAANPNKQCPATLDEVAKFFGADPGLPTTVDAWGHPLVMKCDDSGFKIFSVGPDGKADTDDDVRSW